MGINRSATLFFIILVLQAMISPRLLSQDRCATTEFINLQEKFHPSHESIEQFEKWLRVKRQERISLLPRARSANTTEVITIPVVVHVIHRGELIGTGTNITDAQVQSQIDVLNEDFRRMNADAVNTPPEFQPVAADAEIQFQLAVRDPEGLPTDGIVRINGLKGTWDLSDNYELKHLSYWPAEDYLNIYVVNMNDNFVGYAQFPESDLAGLEDASENPFTDGVIVDYKAFGSIEKYPDANLFSQFDLGRTTTHEVGHYLGLRHIWGDSENCNVDDFVADTPAQSSHNGGIGSPCTFPGPNSCSGGLPDMFQNYMDYTNDVCMNLFTAQQVERMQLVLDNSPRRASLRNSMGLVPPVTLASDAGIRNILSPSPFACREPFAPVAELRNYGTNTISTVEVATYLNFEEFSRNVYSISLAPGESGTLALPLLTLSESGTLSIEVTSVNGASDQNPANNSKSIDFVVSEETGGQLTINFDSVPVNWQISNPDGLFTWESIVAPNAQEDNRALFINFYDYAHLGELDLFTSPVIDLTAAMNAVLTFDVAYSGYSGPLTDGEGLLVSITDDCESPLYAGDTIYLKYADDLRTTPAINDPFVPAGAEQWRTEVVNLLPYLGKKVRLSFIGKNSFGNNLYIDNIAIDLGDPYSIISPDYVFCEDEIPLGIHLTNVFPVQITYLEIDVAIDGNTTTYAWEGLIQPEQTAEISAMIAPLPPGEHTIEATIKNINNTGLSYGPAVSASRRVLVNNNSRSVPFRENFENYRADTPDAWVSLSQDDLVGFEPASTNHGTSIGILNSKNNLIGDVDIFASPIFSLENATQAHFNFDLAYQQVNKTGDTFELRVSTNCGMTYDEIVFSRGNDDWPAFSGTPNSIPDEDAQWESISVDLSQYAGQEIRLAMITINANGGNLFVDNFEFFVTQPVIAVNGTIFPNPVGSDDIVNITFNVTIPENVEVRVINSLGQVMVTEEFSNILNQTIPFNMGPQAPGVYIIQVNGDTFSFSKRIVYGVF